MAEAFGVTVMLMVSDAWTVVAVVAVVADVLSMTQEVLEAVVVQSFLQ